MYVNGNRATTALRRCRYCSLELLAPSQAHWEGLLIWLVQPVRDNSSQRRCSWVSKLAQHQPLLDMQSVPR
jgi:hypothetical protein